MYVVASFHLLYFCDLILIPKLHLNNKKFALIFVFPPFSQWFQRRFLVSVYKVQFNKVSG